MNSTAAPSIASDPVLPAVATLLGDGAHDVLSAGLGPSGGELLSTRASDVAWWPGRSITVAYVAEVRWPDGTIGVETLVATAGDAVPDGALLLEGDTGAIGMWRAPFDPALPGLAPVLDPQVLAALLRDLGVDSDADTLSTQIAAYRPGRRAVVQVRGPRGRLFLKVVRPHKAGAIHERHRQLRPHVPVPESLGWSPEHGVVALEALPGSTVRDALATGEPLPGPGAILTLLDSLPEPPDGARSWGWRAAELGSVVSAAVPSLAGRVTELAGRLELAESALDPGKHPPVPVHGDLHDAQLLTVDGAVTGLLDVDTHAIGRRVDDLATAIGHLSTLATAVPHGEAVRDHARRLLGGFDAVTDPAALRRGVAAVVLGLATGPFRVQEPGWHEATRARVELAAMWLDSAEEIEGSAR